MSIADFGQENSLACADTQVDRWVAVNVCGCAEYKLSTGGPPGDWE